jgi:hypothetical protein
MVETVGRTPWAGDQLASRPLPTQDNTNTDVTLTYVRVSSGIPTHDPSTRASENISCRRPRGHRIFRHKSNNKDRRIGLGLCTVGCRLCVT